MCCLMTCDESTKQVCKALLLLNEIKTLFLLQGLKSGEPHFETKTNQVRRICAISRFLLERSPRDETNETRLDIKITYLAIKSVANEQAAKKTVSLAFKSSRLQFYHTFLFSLFALRRSAVNNFQ